MQQWQDNVVHQKSEWEPKYDLAVVIGRFQPFHFGHKALIDFASGNAKRILVLLGSSYVARNSKNPFSAEEREQMIRCNYDEFTNQRMEFDYLVDDLYNDQQWITSVQEKVRIASGDSSVCLVGHTKDDSSNYLKWFPKLDYIEAPNTESLHATDIRTSLYETGIITSNVPDGTKFFISGWISSNREEFSRLREEHHFVVDYKKQFATLPYPPIFVTTDAVVICGGHILLVKRRAALGRGLWALPGGFLNANERIENCIIRELEEETRIKVPTFTLKASLKGTHVFDAPGRSLRGRTITHAGLIVLNNRELPKVRGSDDAEKAKWVSLIELYGMPNKMYEDHYSIATYMINRIGYTDFVET